MNEAWDETVENLQRIDPTTTEGRLKGHAYVSFLEQILVAGGTNDR
jgi:hypothetical protein